MKPISGRLVIEIIGVSSIVASLLFVGMELRQSEISAQNDRSLSRIEREQAWRAQTNEHSDIWVSGNAGSELTSQERAVYENLLLDYWSFVGTIALTGERQGIEPKWNPEVVKFALFLYSNPGAEETWRAQTGLLLETWNVLRNEPQVLNNSQSYVLEHLESLKSNYQ